MQKKATDLESVTISVKLMFVIYLVLKLVSVA